MKSLCLIAALVAGVSFSLMAEEPVTDLAAQKQALSKEIYLIREEFIKTDPTFAAERRPSTSSARPSTKRRNKP